MGNKSSSSSASGGGKGSASTIVADAVTASHVLRVNDYCKIKGIGVGKSIDSGIFRAGGYTWSVRYYPDGRVDACADWISVSLFLRTPLSTENSIVVMARFKFSLLDQDGEPVAQHQLSTREVVTFSANNKIWGFDQFIKRDSDLEGSEYLKDDSFRIKCEVTVFKNGFARVKSSKNEKSPKGKKYVDVPPSKLNRELAGVPWAGEAPDVTFQVGSETSTAHRNVLAARSPVFKAELFGPMRENSAAGSHSRVQISDMEPGVFRAMLHFIYTDSLQSMGTKEGIIMAQHLLVAADRYDLEMLRLVCEDKLCGHIDRNNAAATLVLAEQHGCQGLKKACFAFLMARGNLKAAMATEGYDHLRSSCPSLLDELISKLAP